MKPSFGIGRTIRGARRTREILGVLVSYGFQNVIQELNLDDIYQKSKNFLTGKKVDATIARLPHAVRLRKAMEELGPTFVKLGQVLSLRPDLIPPDWADEFRKLQSTVESVPFEKIRKQLESEYGSRLNELFESIDEEPLAAASIAQVHRAVAKDGTKVVLKVLRPGIEEVLQSDMDILHWLAEFAEDRFADLAYSPTEVVEQFAEELEREVDLKEEGRACDRFNRYFEENPDVSFPRVHWDLTTQRVLAMEEIHGILLSNMKDGDLSDEDIEKVVANGTDAVFRQCLEIGFFHADPHPGNIFAMPGGKICFIDCGMTGHVDPNTQEHLADLVQGVIAMDLDRVIEVVVALGDADPAIGENRSFRADTWEFIARFENVDLAKLDMGAMLQDFFERIRRNHLRVPADIVFLIKAITTIEGVGERLMPEFDIVGHVRPHVERLVRRRYGIKAIRHRFQHSLLGYLALVEDLPAQVRSIFFSFRRSRVTINLEHRGLDRLTDTINRASGNIAHSVFAGSLILGSSILILADSVLGEPGLLSVFAWLGLIAAVTLTVIRIVGNKLW
jgi:ubiquinone biosynthesis protein